jgi:hypothetical protein
MMYVMVVAVKENQAREYLKAHTACEGILVHVERWNEEANYVFRVEDDWPEEGPEMLHDLFNLPDLQNAPCIDADEIDIHP